MCLTRFLSISHPITYLFFHVYRSCSLCLSFFIQMTRKGAGTPSCLTSTWGTKDSKCSILGGNWTSLTWWIVNPPLRGQYECYGGSTIPSPALTTPRSSTLTYRSNWGSKIRKHAILSFSIFSSYHTQFFLVHLHSLLGETMCFLKLHTPPNMVAPSSE